MRLFLSLAANLLLAAAAAAGPYTPPPMPGAAPLLHVLLSGPPGVSVTFYQGQAPARRFEVPVTVGLRPGYIYRLTVTGFPQRPGLELHPTLEVRGTLRLPADLPASRHPAPVYLSEFDAERLLDGSLITKVLYLENPKKAFPEAGRKDQPFELELPPERDLLEESRQFGRPVLVFRAGNRDVSDEELRRDSVNNTILFPTEKDLGLPRVPPPLAWVCFPWYDPTHGPRGAEEECLHDGGDTGDRAGFGPDGRLEGIDPEDTVAEYRDSEGNKKIAVSNRVCLCVPRFAVLRTILNLERSRLALGPAAVRRVDTQQLMESALRTARHQQLEHAADAIARQSASEMQASLGTAVTGKIEGTQFVASRMGPANISAVCRETPRTPDRPLLLQKWSDRPDAEVGDEVQFTLKYVNQGGRPISDVAVSDSLTGRLEYIAGSAQSSRNAVFTSLANESGSLLLRWQINGVLQPGDSGVVRFKVRVR
jgi:uncharacterized repeat protein (TIGR01451 family)